MLLYEMYSKWQNNWQDFNQMIFRCLFDKTKASLLSVTNEFRSLFEPIKDDLGVETEYTAAQDHQQDTYSLNIRNFA